MARGSRQWDRQTLRPAVGRPISRRAPRRRSAWAAIVAGIAASFVAVVTAHASLPVERLTSAPGLAPFEIPLGLPALLFEASPALPRAVPVAEPSKVSELKTNPYHPLAARPRAARTSALPLAFERVSDLKTNPYL